MLDSLGSPAPEKWPLYICILCGFFPLWWRTWLSCIQGLRHFLMNSSPCLFLRYNMLLLVLFCVFLASTISLSSDFKHLKFSPIWKEKSHSSWSPHFPLNHWLHKMRKVSLRGHVKMSTILCFCHNLWRVMLTLERQRSEMLTNFLHRAHNPASIVSILGKKYYSHFDLGVPPAPTPSHLSYLSLFTSLQWDSGSPYWIPLLMVTGDLHKVKLNEDSSDLSLLCL